MQACKDLSEHHDFVTIVTIVKVEIERKVYRMTLRTICKLAST